MEIISPLVSHFEAVPIHPSLKLARVVFARIEPVFIAGKHEEMGPVDLLPMNGELLTVNGHHRLCLALRYSVAIPGRVIRDYKDLHGVTEAFWDQHLLPYILQNRQKAISESVITYDDLYRRVTTELGI